MSAGAAVIDMAAERGGPTARDRAQHRSLLHAEPRMLVDEGVTLRVEDIGHLHGRPAHGCARFPQEPGPVEDHRRRHLQLLERIRRRLQVTPREVQIDRRVREVGVARAAPESCAGPRRLPADASRNECRSVWGLTCLSMPALRAANRTASQIDLAR